MKLQKFEDVESSTGVRLTFNAIPNTKAHHAKYAVPLAIAYSPLYPQAEETHPSAPPSRHCTKCGCLVSPYNKRPRWNCHFCKTANDTPVEGIGKWVCQEYIVKAGPETGILFVVDTSISDKELSAAVSALKELIPQLPRNIYIGLVSFAKNVYIHNLCSEQPSVVAVDGCGKDPSAVLAGFLKGTSYDQAKKRYFMPISQVDDRILFELDLLCGEEEQEGRRPSKATGQALKTAAAFCEIFTDVNIRVTLLVGGACTVGEGKVIGESMAETFRSFYDLKESNQNCKYLKAGCQFYSGLKKVFVFRNAVVDVFAYGLDQFGIFEMKEMILRTGGILAMQESFDSEMFRLSLFKQYKATPAGLFRFAMCGRVRLFVSGGLRAQGAIGNCQSLQDKSALAGENAVGEGDTSEWYLGSIDQNTTLTILLQHGKEIAEANKEKNAVFQLRTIFKYSDNKLRERVVSFYREYVPESTKSEVVAKFDQEAALAVMSKLCALRAEEEVHSEVIKFLDRTMFRLLFKSCDFEKYNKNSVKIPQSMKLFPQMVYHLRRSHFINTFGSSPDEIMLYKASLYRQNVQNCCTMVLPTLLEYRVEARLPKPVKLSLQSLQDDVILLLDCYFYVVVWEGRSVHNWKVQNLHHTPDYEYLGEFFEKPLQEVAQILEERLPSPAKYFSFFGDGKERYIKSRVNPAASSQELTENCLTEDVSLKVFMDFLLRSIVTSQL